MKEREELIGDIGNIARGYILLGFNINLGRLNILPNWFGYMIFLSALPCLGEYEQSIKQLRTPCILLIVWELLNWLLVLINLNLNLYVLGLIATVLSLYFHFQFLTNIADIAGSCGCPEENRILKLRTVRTLMITVFALPFPWKEYTTAAIIIAIISAVVGIWICVVMYSLKSSLSTPEDLTPDEQRAVDFHNNVWRD